jgi:hypothetical protein
MITRRLPLVLASLAAALLPAVATLPAQAATCTGKDPCHACKTCEYCKRCAKGGGTCGVCKKSWHSSHKSAVKKHKVSKNPRPA